MDFWGHTRPIQGTLLGPWHNAKADVWPPIKEDKNTTQEKFEEEEMLSLPTDNTPMASVCTEDKIPPGVHILAFSTAKKHTTTYQGKKLVYLDLIFKSDDDQEIRYSAPMQNDDKGNPIIRVGTKAASILNVMEGRDAGADLPPNVDLRPLVGTRYKIQVSYATKNGSPVKTKTNKLVTEIDAILEIEAPGAKATPEADDAEIEKQINIIIGPAGILTNALDGKLAALSSNRNIPISRIEEVARKMIQTGKLTIKTEGTGILAKELIRRA